MAIIKSQYTRAVHILFACLHNLINGVWKTKLYHLKQDTNTKPKF